MTVRKPLTKTMKQMFGRKTEQAKQALSEFTSGSVLCLAFSKPGGGSLRTGLYATLGGSHFVVTAGHQLEGAHLDDFTYQPRPSYKWVRPNDPRGGRVPDAGLPTPTCHVEDRELLDDPQDLLVMRINPLPSRRGWVVPFPLNSCTVAATPFGLKTMIIGYPGDLGRERFCEKLQRSEYVLKPLVLFSHVVEEPMRFGGGFDSTYHFLINYKLKDGDPMQGRDARGVSGSPVFMVPPKEQVIVKPGEMLLGILHLEYPKIQTMRITRIEHVLPVMRKLIARST